MTAPPDLRHPRRIEQTVTGKETADGAGVRLTRLLDSRLHERLDPFLMLDAFGSDDPDDYISGFPDHPHRGFETITYMRAGRMRHRDSAGHEGLLEAGGVQWMIAGRGVIHSEIPEQREGVMAGFQLWLNLPARDKMTAPTYRDFAAAEIPEYTTPDGARVKVIAGVSQGVTGAMTRPVTEPLYLDIALPAGARFATALPPGHHGFVHPYVGRISVEGDGVDSGQLGLLAQDPDSDGVRILALEDSRLLLIAGRPLAEPIVHYGPFVMNSPAEIHQAIEDFRAGRLA
ncbi:MAG: pirin family protein [Pseudomonadota bacterium]